MSIRIIECPHCCARVVPTGDGTCPACRKNTQEEPTVAPQEDTRAAPEEAWDKYQESLRSTSAAPAIDSLKQVDEEFVELRTRAVANLRTNGGVDTAAADRIDRDLLPRYVEAIEQLQRQVEADSPEDRDIAEQLELAKTRMESWKLLSEALRYGDVEKLPRHSELWERSEILLIDSRVRKTPSATPPSAQRVREFQQALVTFTPRLIGTPAVVIANLLVFAAMLVSGVHFFAPTPQSVLEWGANFGPKTLNGEWWRLVTCMFLHYGILHLAFNMWVLWDLGRLVERMAGNFGFFVIYFVSGIAGSIASLAWNPMVVSAGASGAVFGIGGALLGLLVFGHENVPAAVLKQLRNSMTAFLIYNLLYGMTASGIDMAAHVGGLVAGFVCGLILSQPLSLEMLSRRRLRNVGVLGAAAILLPLAALALPEAPPDIEAEMLRFAAVERKAIDTNNTLVRKSQSGTVSDLEFADTLEREVLPPWTETRKRIEELIDVPYADREHLSRLAEFMRCREESWQMQVAGLREQDPVKLEQANDSWTRAEEMVKEITSR